MHRSARVAAAIAIVVPALSVAAARRPKPDTADIPTYSKDVAPILYKNCTGCHRPGEIAPMSLLTYDDVRPRGDTCPIERLT
jgi:hypothetical protein